MKTFADQAVIAIENVRLFDEVQAKTRDLDEALQFSRRRPRDVLRSSAAPLRPGACAAAIVDTAADLCQADMSVVRLLGRRTPQCRVRATAFDPATVLAFAGPPRRD